MPNEKFSDLVADHSDINISELNIAIANCRSPLEISSALRKVLEGSASKATQKASTLLSIIAGFHYKEDDDVQPFTPEVVWPDGKRSPIPEDLSSAQIDLLRKILPSIESAHLKALIADILWIEKRTETKPHLRSIACIAIDSYLESAKSNLANDDMFEFVRALRRATRISTQISAGEPQLQRIQDLYHEALNKEADCKKPGVLHRLMDLGVKANLQNPQEISRTAAIFAEKIEASKNWESAANFWGIASRLDSDDAGKFKLSVAQCYERAAQDSAKNDNHFAAVHYQEKAIEVYRRFAGTKQQRLNAQKLLRQWQPLLKKHLKPISHEVDIRDLVKGSRDLVAGKTLYQALLAFVRITSPPRLDKIIADVKERNKQFVLSQMFGGTVLDNEGKTVFRYGPLFGNESGLDEPSFRHQVVQEFNMYQGLTAQAQICPSVAQITSEHKVTDALLLPIIQNSPFVPGGYEHIFCEAFRLAFDGRIMLTLHLLLPQMENSLRNILKQHDVLTYRIKLDSTHEDLNLNELLYGPCGEKLATIIGKDTLFDLQSLLVDRSGPNLRNVVAHGKASVSMMYSGSSWYLFWLTFRLCCIPLFQHWNELETLEQQTVGTKP